MLWGTNHNRKWTLLVVGNPFGYSAYIQEIPHNHDPMIPSVTCCWQGILSNHETKESVPYRNIPVLFISWYWKYIVRDYVQQLGEFSGGQRIYIEGPLISLLWLLVTSALKITFGFFRKSPSRGILVHEIFISTKHIWFLILPVDNEKINRCIRFSGLSYPILEWEIILSINLNSNIGVENIKFICKRKRSNQSFGNRSIDWHHETPSHWLTTLDSSAPPRRPLNPQPFQTPTTSKPAIFSTPPPVAEFCVRFWSLFHSQDHLVLSNSIR